VGVRLSTRTHARLDRFVLLYIVGLLVSSAGTWLQHREEPDYRSLGASGAILAVLFASIVYFPTGSIYILPLPVPIPAPLFAVAYLAYTVYARGRRAGESTTTPTCRAR
jgi:membrane associated rhomboid family serine protease